MMWKEMTPGDCVNLRSMLLSNDNSNYELAVELLKQFRTLDVSFLLGEIITYLYVMENVPRKYTRFEAMKSRVLWDDKWRDNI